MTLFESLAHRFSAFAGPDHETWLLGLFATSVVTFFGTLVALPLFVVWMPADHFLEPHAREAETSTTEGPLATTLGRRVLRIAARIAKNLFGVVFVLGGLAMLVLPGQGILTLLLGVSLLDFPGKRALERRLAMRPGVRQGLDRLRARFGRAPLRFPGEPHETP